MSDSDQKRQEITRQVVQKIVDDPTFREEIVTDPENAMKKAGFADELSSLYPQVEAEVSGYAMAGSSSCCASVIIIY